jgi:hypothetical protein
MPEHWQPKERGQTSTRSVPLKFCRRAILGLSRNAILNTDADISFMLQYDGNIRIVTKSLSIERFGWLVKNTKILPLIRESGGFQKTGSSWVGSFAPKDLDTVIDLIYVEKSCNAMLSASQVELVQPDIVRTEVRQKERFDMSEITKRTGAPDDFLKSHVPVVKPEPIEFQQTNPNNDKERRLRIVKAKAKSKLKILNLLKSKQNGCS